MAIFEVTVENFERDVLDASQPVLLDFRAAWCGPCGLLAPVLREIADERPDLHIGTVDVDEQTQLAQAFHAAAIPMLALIAGGKPLAAITGARPKQELLQFVDRTLQQADSASVK